MANLLRLTVNLSHWLVCLILGSTETIISVWGLKYQTRLILIINRPGPDESAQADRMFFFEKTLPGNMGLASAPIKVSNQILHLPEGANQGQNLPSPVVWA